MNQVINASSAPAVFRTPYMFARKVEPSVDAETVRLWDEWMAKKLRGQRHDDQEVLGGTTPRVAAGDILSNLERSASSGGGGGAGEEEGGWWAEEVPRPVGREERFVSRVDAAAV